ncbi:MAG TPA: serine/threonine-protein kinase, partial [Spirillospora sp.]
PGVVAVHDFLIEDGRPWIVMEFVESCSLNRLVAENGPLGVRRTAEIGAAVLSVLRASHAAGILHRDVKPSNVLICEDGRILLTDFGLAVHMAKGGKAVDTMPAGIEGSPAYLAPERVNGMPGVEASDLWSLGATLYLAVEGFAPFLRCHALASMMAVVLGDYAPPERAGPLTPVIEGLLRQRPEDRLTAEETAERLARVLGTVPEPGATPAGPVPGLHRMRGFGTRRLPLPRRVPWVPWTQRGAWGTPGGTRSRVFRGPRVPWTLRGGRRTGRPGNAQGGAACGARRPGPRWRPRIPALITWRRVRPGAVAGVAALAVVAAGAGTWAARWTSVGQGDPVALRPAAGVTPKTTRYRNAGAYSVRVPVGWRAEQSGTVVRWKDVRTGRGLRITMAPGDPLEGLLAEERRAIRERRYPGYHRLRLEHADELFAGAAEWEFTWRGERTVAFEDGVRHVLCSRAAGYEFCFSAPDRQWTPGQRLFVKILATFRPEQG